MADARPIAPRKAHPAVRVLVGLLTTASCVVTGGVLGIVFVKLFVPRRGMGWDQMADALGGLMVGALIGLILGIALAIRLTPRRQFVAVGVAVAVFGACWLYLYLTRGASRTASAVDLPAPRYALEMERIQHPQHEEVLRAWAAESEERLDAFRRGEMAAIPVEEVFAEIEDLRSDHGVSCRSAET